MKKTLLGCVVAASLSLSATAGLAQTAPFGTDADAEYAQLLWDLMVKEKLAGDNMIRAFPYEGAAPHGKMLEAFYTEATLKGNTGSLVIKRNYGPEGVTEEQVLADPDKYLGSVTVMYRREAGYDEDNGNWFWVKYLPNGSLDKNPKGMRLAGRVAKGASKGCIACHSLAGPDMLYTTDHMK
jgi:hypothetical protein